jgi:tRNA threonylcarbamoyladenosine biosynthesis protein TsaB
MNLLALDCSTSRGSVALLSNGQLLFHEEFVAQRSHTAFLFSCLQRARALVPHVHRVTVGLGPGSYAGTRVAISAALGFQLGLGSELVGVPSVAALQTDAAEYLAISDARRDAFSFTHIRSGICLTGPRLATEEELHDLLAAHPELPVFSPEPLPGFDRATLALPSAVILAALGTQDAALVQRDILEPIYLREPHITQPKASAQKA